MKVQVEIDPTCKETEIVIRTHELTDEINEMIQKISVSHQKTLAGFIDDEVHLLEASDLVRIYSVDKKVIAETGLQAYILRMRLYELEERLDSSRFVRISHSEIVNLKAIKKIDLSFTGTIAMTLSNKKTAYVSRRYVSKIKTRLGI